MGFSKVLFITSMLILTAYLSSFLEYEVEDFDSQNVIKYNSIIPTEIGPWEIVKKQFATIVNPGEQQVINELYSETVERNYFSQDHGLIMLSMAYGPYQTDKIQVHKPEVCYPAQGLEIEDMYSTEINLLGRGIPVTRMVASRGQKKEFVTYWIKSGDRVFNDDIDRKIYSLKKRTLGESVDGLLFRVSSIGLDAEGEFQKQGFFIAELLGALPDEYKATLIGKRLN